MKKEDGILLANDLCCRLQYGVLLRCLNPEVDEVGYATGNWVESTERLFGINLLNVETVISAASPIITVDEEGIEGCYSLYEIKPYLRPMSSMTDEEYWELDRIVNYSEAYINQDNTNDKLAKNATWYLCHSRGLDYLNSHHFDYRGLISKGLALQAPEDMYKFDKN